MLQKLINYLKGSREEIKKVVWPSKKEATRYTTVIIVITLFLAAFLGLLDFLLAKVFQLIIS